MAMMIYNVSNFQHFFQSLDKCGDNLTLVTPDGKAYDWKANRSFLLSFLKTLDVSRCNKLEIRPVGTEAASRILCYMLEGEKSAAH